MYFLTFISSQSSVDNYAFRNRSILRATSGDGSDNEDNVPLNADDDRSASSGKVDPQQPAAYGGKSAKDKDGFGNDPNNGTAGRRTKGTGKPGKKRNKTGSNGGGRNTNPAKDDILIGSSDLVVNKLDVPNDIKSLTEQIRDLDRLVGKLQYQIRRLKKVVGRSYLQSGSVLEEVHYSLTDIEIATRSCSIYPIHRYMGFNSQSLFNRINDIFRLPVYNDTSKLNEHLYDFNDFKMMLQSQIEHYRLMRIIFMKLCIVKMGLNNDFSRSYESKLAAKFGDLLTYSQIEYASLKDRFFDIVKLMPLSITQYECELINLDMAFEVTVGQDVGYTIYFKECVFKVTSDINRPEPYDRFTGSTNNRRLKQPTGTVTNGTPDSFGDLKAQVDLLDTIRRNDYCNEGVLDLFSRTVGNFSYHSKLTEGVSDTSMFVIPHDPKRGLPLNDCNLPVINFDDELPVVNYLAAPVSSPAPRVQLNKQGVLTLTMNDLIVESESTIGNNVPELMPVVNTLERGINRVIPITNHYQVRLAADINIPDLNNILEENSILIDCNDQNVIVHSSASYPYYIWPFEVNNMVTQYGPNLYLDVNGKV